MMIYAMHACIYCVASSGPSDDGTSSGSSSSPSEEEISEAIPSEDASLSASSDGEGHSEEISEGGKFQVGLCLESIRVQDSMHLSEYASLISLVTQSSPI